MNAPVGNRVDTHDCAIGQGPEAFWKEEGSGTKLGIEKILQAERASPEGIEAD
jgi:hypothetical protein